MARFVKFPGTAGSFASTDDVNLLDCDSSWFAQGTGGLWTVGAPSAEQAWINTQSLKVLAGASTAITPVSDAAFFSLYVYSAAGDTFDINGSTPVVVPAGVWTRIKEAGPDGTYTVSAVGAADYYLDGVIVQATDATFVPSLRIVGDLDLRYLMAADDWGTDGKRNSYVQRSTMYGIYDTSATAGTLRFQYLADTGPLTVESTTVLDSFLTAGVAAELKHIIDWSAPEWRTYIDGTLRATSALVGTEFDPAAGQLNVGGLGTLFFAGDVYNVTVRDGEDGPIVAEFNAEDIAIP